MSYSSLRVLPIAVDLKRGRRGWQNRSVLIMPQNAGSTSPARPIRPDRQSPHSYTPKETDVQCIGRLIASGASPLFATSRHPGSQQLKLVHVSPRPPKLTQQQHLEVDCCVQSADAAEGSPKTDQPPSLSFALSHRLPTLCVDCGLPCTAVLTTQARSAELGRAARVSWVARPTGSSRAFLNFLHYAEASRPLLTLLTRHLLRASQPPAATTRASKP